MKKILSLSKNQKGFGHTVVLVGLAVVVGVSAIGYVVYTRSSAATSPAAVCGNGYTAYKSTALFGPDNNKRPDIGTLHILRKSTSNEIIYCGVVTSGSATEGKAKYMEVDAGEALTIMDKDSGTYKYYAGPVRYHQKLGYPVVWSIGGEIKYNDKRFSAKY